MTVARNANEDGGEDLRDWAGLHIMFAWPGQIDATSPARVRDLIISGYGRSERRFLFVSVERLKREPEWTCTLGSGTTSIVRWAPAEHEGVLEQGILCASARAWLEDGRPRLSISGDGPGGEVVIDVEFGSAE